ncbi:right-handed parallel beta-helix repeat-containing protein [Candidatus Eisenbacteria bacterium]|uniref:Right-handed parallel beta-helix repeat-containing protein n=1 Tax=Eiseniibacteriota bacterium TaxID=2212470 RepID=A0ABV6YLC0_UNCEI
MKTQHVWLYLGLCILCAVLTPSSVAARSWYILPDGTGDAPTIQAGIDSTAVGDTVLVGCGTYNEHDIVMRPGITLRSETGEADCVTIDAQELGRVFYCEDFDSTTSLEGLTITGGRATSPGMESPYRGGGMYCKRSSLRLDRCSLLDNDASVGGGTGAGGGICCDSSSMTLSECDFSDNYTDGPGGAIYGEESSLVVTGCNVFGNWGYGAGIACLGSSLEVTGSDLTGNHAGPPGGGAIYSYASAFTVIACSIVNNHALGGNDMGGGIYSDYSEATIMDSEFLGNIAYRGGGVQLEHSYGITITNCLFVDNLATVGPGGAIFCYDSDPIIAGCTLAGNGAAGGGGGIYCMHYSFPQLENTIIAFSTTGEAVYCEDPEPSHPTLTCCNVYGSAGGDWVGCIADQGGLNGNFSADPRFCDMEAGDFRLASCSPCIHGECGQIGAFGQGCWCEEPRIAGISDIGNDQGRQVRIRWLRSLYDAEGEPVITGYGIYRRQDEYLRGGRIDGWDYLNTVPATADSAYQLVVPTLCDSTADGGICWSVFFIRALTSDPPVYYQSAPDSGYSIDNLAPEPPENLRFEWPLLAWDEAVAEDFDYFSVYGSDSPDFAETAELIGYTSELSMDIRHTGYLYYHVTARDFAGNEGEAVSIGVDWAGLDNEDGQGHIPGKFGLHPSNPNPSGTGVLVSFDLPVEADVTLTILDAAGRSVARLADGRFMPGSHSVLWPCRDEAGRPVSPGVYFCRMEAPEFNETRKLLIAK